MRSKARRWTGVGSLILSKVAPPIVMVVRVRVARWPIRQVARALGEQRQASGGNPSYEPPF
jgi:hypothetical protein